MVTYFNKKDLVSFGNFLLSSDRRKRFSQISEENLEERLSQVHHADVENWKLSAKSK